MGGLYSEGLIYGRKFAFHKTDQANLTVGSKFTVFALFYFVFEGNFPSTSPPGDLYLERQFNGGFFALPVWGDYFWRDLYMEDLIFGIDQKAFVPCYIDRGLFAVTQNLM